MQKTKKIVTLLMVSLLGLSIFTGCDRREKIDAFENLDVEFMGISPNAKMKECKGKKEMVEYKINQTDNLKNGDKVIISAEVIPYFSEEYVLQENQREYTVEGLPWYPSKVDEIPTEMQDKMKKQAEDGIKAEASTWAKENSIKSADFLGYYYVTPKPAFNTSQKNEIYLVYKITTNIKGICRGAEEINGKYPITEGEEVYYTYYKFKDLIILEDGTGSVDLSKGELCSNYLESDYGYLGSFHTGIFYKYEGYKDLDSMFNENIISQIERCNYENTVKEN